MTKHSLFYGWLSAALCIQNASAFVSPTSNVDIPRTCCLWSTTEESTSSSSTKNDFDSFVAPLHEIERRRNLAIISHPDSGTCVKNIKRYDGFVFADMHIILSHRSSSTELPYSLCSVQYSFPR